MDDQKFPFLALPTEILFNIYTHQDYATRRALRVSGKLAEIEKKTAYRCKNLRIYDVRNHILITFDDVEVEIPHSEVEKEIELMMENTTFSRVACFEARESSDRRTLDAIGLLKAEMIIIGIRILNDDDLESLLTKNKNVVVTESDVTDDGIFRIYEKMRDGQLDCKRVGITRNSANEMWSLMDRFGTFYRDTLQFTATNANHTVLQRDLGEHVKSVIIDDTNMIICFAGINEDADYRYFSIDVL